MDIENIIVDIQLINAYEGKRDKKWKYPKLQYIHHLQDFRKELEDQNALSYERLIMQPIGRRLYFDFCKTTEKYKNHVDFIEAVQRGEDLLEKEAVACMNDLISRYMKPTGNCYLECIEEEDIQAIKVPSDGKTRITETLEDVLDIVFTAIAGTHDDFLLSPFAWRLVQWTNVERSPVTDASFQMYRVLGKGGFGEVFACMKKDTGKMYAVKCQNKKRLKKKNSVSYAWKERDMLASVKSEFVISLKYSYETKDDLCMVIDLMKGGDLNFHIRSIGKFSVDEARFFAAQMVLGIGDLHASDIVYRDMKPENLLLDELGYLRISDLGLATVLPRNKQKKAKAGTPGYMAPEVVSGKGYGHCVDWWGLGMCLYEMIFGHSPFRKPREKVKIQELEDRIQNQEIEFSSNVPADVQSLCRMLLEKEPNKRLGYKGYKKVCDHEFFKDVDWFRLRRHLIVPLFKPSAWVNAKDVFDIDRFDSVKDVKLDDDDIQKFSEFPMVVEHCVQKEMMSTVFQQINKFDVDNPPNDLKIDYIPAEHKTNFFKRLFRGSSNRKNKAEKNKGSTESLKKQNTNSSVTSASDVSAGADSVENTSSTSDAKPAAPEAKKKFRFFSFER